MEKNTMEEKTMESKTRIRWLNKDRKEELVEIEKRKEKKVRMSLYIPESVKAAIAYEARRSSANMGKRVSMSDVVKKIVVLYFQEQYRKEHMIDKEYDTEERS